MSQEPTKDTQEPGPGQMDELTTRILAIAELSRQKQISQPPVANSKKFDRRKWLDRWICLKVDHSKRVADLEDAALDFCQQYARNPALGFRMVIYGPNGVGKTHVAKAIARWASMTAMNLPLVRAEEDIGARVADVRYENWPAFCDHLKSGHWDSVDPLFSVSLLVLDDIGAEHDPSKVGAEKLYLILEKRIRRWTILTTNIAPPDWDIRLERRIASRLLRNCIHVNMEGVPDYHSI